MAGYAFANAHDGLLRFTRNAKNAVPHATNRPDGQITKNLSTLSGKNIPLNMSGKSAA
jgi:hypothetical protein